MRALLLITALLLAAFVPQFLYTPQLGNTREPVPLRTSLRDLPADERADRKADEIVSRSRAMTYQHDDLTIEVISIEKIDGGVQVFAKAWRDGKPLGFGSDGSVEIERFKIYNPPVLVQDNNGSIVLEKIDSRGVSHVRRLREAPAEALRQALAHTISVSAKSGENIVAGKVGNTTSTFYPSEDGNAFRDGVGATWADKHDGAGNSSTRTDANERTGYYRRDGGTWTNVGRSFFGFDTSSIPDTDVVSSATFSLYGTSYENGSFGTDESLAIDRSVPQNEAAIQNTDYNIARWDEVLQSDTTIARSSWNESGYNDFPLNATGISNISTTGNTWLNPRIYSDFLDTEPGSLTNGARSFGAYFSEETGTANDPTLVVTHEAPPVANSTNIIRAGGWSVRAGSIIVK